MEKGQKGRNELTNRLGHSGSMFEGTPKQPRIEPQPRSPLSADKLEEGLVKAAKSALPPTVEWGPTQSAENRSSKSHSSGALGDIDPEIPTGLTYSA